MYCYHSKFIKEGLWDSNEKLLKEEVLSIGHSVETINLLDVTPFELDVVYSFKPYTPKDDIYETVVCYLYGYPENNGYGISFESVDYKDAVFMLKEKDDLNFQVVRSDSLVFLRN